MFTLKLHRIFISLIFALLVNQTLLAQTTAFTYQGKLTSSGTPATGNYDFEFRLFDAASGGAEQGTTQTLTNVAVANGVFTVQLDFGACATCFNGAARFLDISVRPSGGGAYTPLAPRQPLTATPYAIKSLSAAAADGLSVACVNCVTSSQISSVNGSAVTGPIPVASLPTGSDNYIQNGASQQAAANFNISGDGTAGGTLSGSIVNAATQFNLAGNRVLSVSGVDGFFNSNTFAGFLAGASTTPDGSGFGSGNSFFGQRTGWFNTTGHFNSFFGKDAGLGNTTGARNSFFGLGAGYVNSKGDANSFFGESTGFNNVEGSGNTFIGTNADFTTVNYSGSLNTLLGLATHVTPDISNTTAIGARASVTQSNSLVLGSISGVNLCTAATNCTSVNVGIGTTAPAARLQVVTDQDTNPGGISAWDGRHVVIGGTASSGGIGMSYDQVDGVGYIEALSPNVAWRNLVIQSGGGNVGIGTNAPAAKLHVSGSGGVRARVNSDSNAGVALSLSNQPKWSVATVTGGQFQIFNDALGSNAVWIDSATNNVGIGTTSPGTDKLVVDGSLRVTLLGGAGFTALCANVFNQISECSSSRRYKTHIASFQTGLSLVKQLRPVTFDWKQSGEHDLGLVAEEVANVEPLLVTHNDKGEIEGVKYDRVGVVLINAIKEQQAQIEAQRKEIAALKKLICLDHPEAEMCKPWRLNP